MTRLGTRSPSCSGFEAEPLCWLQHSKQVAARLAQAGKLTLWRPAGNRAERSSQAKGEEGEGQKRRGFGEGTLHGDPQAQPPLGQAFPASSPQAAHVSTRLPLYQALKSLQRPSGPTGWQVSYPKGAHRTPAFPFTLMPYLLASSPLWIAPLGCLAQGTLEHLG